MRTNFITSKATFAEMSLLVAAYAAYQNNREYLEAKTNDLFGVAFEVNLVEIYFCQNVNDVIGRIKKHIKDFLEGDVENFNDKGFDSALQPVFEDINKQMTLCTNDFLKEDGTVIDDLASDFKSLSEYIGLDSPKLLDLLLRLNVLIDSKLLVDIDVDILDEIVGYFGSTEEDIGSITPRVISKSCVLINITSKELDGLDDLSWLSELTQTHPITIITKDYFTYVFSDPENMSITKMDKLI
ncbi:MAG: hypothetical protein PF450_09495 [Bacteroidales bacterium]|jgi:hypothetical protein|nr:hypothetical protein [Bacteroidales bacterium]